MMMNLSDAKNDMEAVLTIVSAKVFFVMARQCSMAVCDGTSIAIGSSPRDSPHALAISGPSRFNHLPRLQKIRYINLT